MSNDVVMLEFLSLLYLGFPKGAVTSFAITNYEIASTKEGEEVCDDLFIAMEIENFRVINVKLFCTLPDIIMMD